MAFDFKKEFKEFYLPATKPAIVEMPAMNYLAVRGKGNPNEEGGAYKHALEQLYGIAYTLKMSYKSDYRNFVTEKDVQWAISEATRKKKMDFSQVEFFPYNEGLCVQCMHIGSYDDEPATIKEMVEYAQSQGYRIAIDDVRRHHEIYLGDPRKTSADKLKTVIRYPIR